MKITAFAVIRFVICQFETTKSYVGIDNNHLVNNIPVIGKEKYYPEKIPDFKTVENFVCLETHN